MCTISCIDFGKAHLPATDVRGKDVIEVGSYNVNGSLREHIVSLEPRSYLGVDISAGPGVDRVCSAENLCRTFGPNAFDCLVSTELVEHVDDWRSVITNFKNVVRPNGVIIVTTRSRGFSYHGYPTDYWRYETTDMSAIFADMQLEALAKDTYAPGVFLKARKPSTFVEKDLTDHDLYSIIAGKRVQTVTDRHRLRFYTRHPLWIVPGLLPVWRALATLLPSAIAKPLRSLATPR